ncbi:class I lanthipeptide [Rhodocytophaga aerolata]|uniref:Class I lanthipeptide n=1 Tax=Rhodocytophaga aerolata TaxID=455078 RepID=A0ABT8RDF5_9BACT|nr:class I lanthipeptide [Rhodocytophaga aerolata]MDO1448782.1 class I lanthipeptide [Rhodocytophaga aerolata]
MKKQVKKITLRTDKIVNLSNTQAMNIQGGRAGICPTSRLNANGLISCYDGPK